MKMQANSGTRARWLQRHAENYMPQEDRGQSLLEHLHRDTWLMSHNQNSNFDQDFLAVMQLIKNNRVYEDFNYLNIMQYFAYPMFYCYYVTHSNQNQVESYLSWAKLDPNVASLYINGKTVVTDPTAVQNGTELWIVDVIAPTGAIRPLIAKASLSGQQSGVPEQHLRFVRRYKNGKTRSNTWSYRHRHGKKK